MRFKPNLWLFSTFFGPLRLLLPYDPYIKFELFGSFLSIDTHFEQIFFVNVLKGPFRPLWIHLSPYLQTYGKTFSMHAMKNHAPFFKNLWD